MNYAMIMEELGNAVFYGSFSIYATIKLRTATINLQIKFIYFNILLHGAALFNGSFYILFSEI